MGGASVAKQWSCTARVIRIYFVCVCVCVCVGGGVCRRRETDCGGGEGREE